MESFFSSCHKRCEQGFSLLEMLIALSILSLISLALFQSTTLLLQTSDKAAGVGERILDEAIVRRIFYDLVGDLVPAWDEYTDEVFKGSADGFSGLSARVPVSEGHSLALFDLKLETSESGYEVLLLKSGGESWPLYRLPEGQFKFHYLGVDRVWYENWPPEAVPSPGFFDDALYMTVPQLPLAIRLQDMSQIDNAQDQSVYWVAAYNGSGELPFREDARREDEL